MSNRPGEQLVLEHARELEQQKVMEDLLRQGICPFCPQHLPRAKFGPVLKQSLRWHVRENFWPYDNTRVHLLVVPFRHIERLAELTADEVRELFELLQWAEREYGVESGAVGIRFGDPRGNGGTVTHLHVHFIVANITDKDDPKYQPVRFRVG
ncbi:HIT domain-containing protein [Candidatus Parcubacteria bacterium]|nr:HIT domain-containing protein [Candidatus Parcubacteria bacterium]